MSPLDHDVSPSAGDDALDLCLLGLRDSELVKCLLEIVQKGLPFCRCDHEMLVGVLHGAARVLLRPAGGPTDHFSDQILETSSRNSMVGLVYPWVRVQAGINH